MYLKITQEIPLWRQVLRQNFTSWEKLADFLELNCEQRNTILAKPRFPLNLPIRLANKVAKGTLDDPILRQFLPVLEEEYSFPGFVSDPVGDQLCKKGTKLLHKYQGRVLLVCTSACAMHCRYCFRQNYDYQCSDKSFNEELKIIAEDTSIREVILSGGDPLSLPDRTLDMLLSALSQMPHVRHVRFHTRFPIGIPERIDDAFLNILLKFPNRLWFVIHCNHPSELDEEILSKLALLQKMGVQILNQAVLLKGVNDSIATLKALCEKLIDHGIMPYYLHQLDRVQGAAHFEVSEEEGRRLVQEMAALMPGYAVPKYVREIAGETSKTSLL